MVDSSILYQYFRHFSEQQIDQFNRLFELYSDHNARVNVISRKDMDNFYIHHVLHSLTLLEFASFDQAQKVVDIGTGGGFPGIPLAIALPEIQFHLVDSIGKKINVVNSVAESIGLKNVKASHIRIEDLKEQFDMAVSRAVAPTKDLLVWMHQHWKGPVNMALLKGGDLSEELNEALDARPKLKFQVKSIQSKFKEPFFETKKVVLVKSS